jgi:hypothetical protein
VLFHCSVSPRQFTALKLCIPFHPTGCGLLGLSLVAAFGCSALITDTQQVLSLVRDNIQRNAAQLEPHPPLAMPLDWESASHLRAVAAKGPFDLLVATDVVGCPRRPLRAAHACTQAAYDVHAWVEENASVLGTVRRYSPSAWWSLCWTVCVRFAERPRVHSRPRWCFCACRSARRRHSRCS